MKLRWLVLTYIVCGCAARDATTPTANRSSGQTPTLALFQFHNASWINLHHVLWGLSIKRENVDRVDTAGLGDQDARTWSAAIEFYAASYAKRDFTFDNEMADINDRISRIDDGAGVADAGVPADLAATLSAAMPIYRAHFWPAHQRANRAWIASVEPYLEQHGAALSRELARTYRAEWPSDPLLVDVVQYASWAGAYATLGPDHLTISSADERNQGSQALEILFHEASHAIVRPLRDALDKELAAQNKSARDLWHAALFYSTGFLVKGRLGRAYVPYAYKNQVYTRAWAAYLPALESAWTPYLDGRTSFESAVHELVTAIP